MKYFLLLLLVIAKSSFAQQYFSNLTATTDSSYGYTTQNPLKLKKGNQEKSIINSRMFLSGLKTTDNQALMLLQRSSTGNPTYNEPGIKFNNRKTGLPLGGNLGILDRYVFITSLTKDTITLYVDIYKKGKVMLPIGLKYEQN